jgi:YbbR domain-containing protein
MSGQHFRGPAAGGPRDLVAALWRQALATMRRTPGLLVLSIALGVAVWIFVTEEENPTRAGLFPSQIPVTFVNVGEELAVANDLGAVDVRIEAPEDRWDGLSTANFEASVDLSGLTAREQNVPVRVEVGGVRGVRILSVEPPTISVNLEEVVSRIIPVEPRLLGALPRGFEAEQAVPERLTVEISGPESLVGLVQSAVAEINVAGLTVGFEQSVELVPRGEGDGEIRGLTVQPPSVSVSVAVRQTVVTKTLPLTVDLLGEPAAGYRVTGVAVQPGVAEIEGPIEALQELEELPLGLVRLDGANEDIRLALAPELPEGVIAPDGPAEAEVIVTIEAVMGSTVLTVVPEAGAVPEGLVADLGDQVITVVLDGPLPLLNALELGDVRAEVDVDLLAGASGELLVTIVVPDEITVREWRPGLVSVTLIPVPTGDEG